MILSYFKKRSSHGDLPDENESVAPKAKKKKTVNLKSIYKSYRITPHIGAPCLLVHAIIFGIKGMQLYPDIFLKNEVLKIANFRI